MRHARFPVFPTSAFALTVLLATLARGEESRVAGIAGDAAAAAAAKALTIAVDGEKLTINGQAVTLPCDRAALEAALGKPDREAALTNVVLTWDQLGVLAYEDKKLKKIRQVSVALDKDDLKFWPAKLFAGTLTVDGAKVGPRTPIDEVNRGKSGSKFEAKPLGSSTWQQITYDNTMVVLHPVSEKVGAKDVLFSSLAVDCRLANKAKK